jgi:hypothetical protein
MNPIPYHYQDVDAFWVGFLAAACQCAIDTLGHGQAREAKRQLVADLGAFLRSPVASRELKEVLRKR